MTLQSFTKVVLILTGPSVGGKVHIVSHEKNPEIDLTLTLFSWSNFIQKRFCRALIQPPAQSRTGFKIWWGCSVPSQDEVWKSPRLKITLPPTLIFLLVSWWTSGCSLQIWTLVLARCAQFGSAFQLPLSMADHTYQAHLWGYCRCGTADMALQLDCATTQVLNTRELQHWALCLPASRHLICP